MKARIDVAKVEAALKRAARTAIHGTREERSGRFLLPHRRETAMPKAEAKHLIGAPHRD